MKIKTLILGALAGAGACMALAGPTAAYVTCNRDGDFARQESHLCSHDRKRAFAKDRFKGVVELVLDLRPPLPPPAHHIDDVARGRKERCIRSAIMPVPRPSLLGLDLADEREVPVLDASRRLHTKTGRRQQTK